jgi:hypothetical protein
LPIVFLKEDHPMKLVLEMSNRALESAGVTPEQVENHVRFILLDAMAEYLYVRECAGRVTELGIESYMAKRYPDDDGYSPKFRAGKKKNLLQRLPVAQALRSTYRTEVLKED